MLNRFKIGLLNLGLKLVSVDEKVVRMLLETSPSNVNEIVLYPSIKIMMRKIVNKLQNKRVRGRVYNGTLNGVNVSVIRNNIGSGNTASDIECLRRCKTKKIIRVDICGGIEIGNNPVQIANLLVSKLAYCADGVSPQYLALNPDLLSKLSSVDHPFSKIHEIQAGNQKVYISKPDDQLKDILLKEGRLKYPNRTKEVDCWTFDALFCETNEYINAIKTLNVQGIDMENAILFLLGQLYDIKTASILSVSDLPGNATYDMLKSNEIHPDMEKGMNNAIEVVLKALPKIKNL